MKTPLAIFLCMILLGVAVRAEYATAVHGDGPDKLVVESGGELEILSGGTLDIQTGATVGLPAGTYSGDMTLDDGSGDSPVVIWTDADDETLTVLKLDAGAATVTNSEGALNLLLSGDADDYFTFATAANVPTIGTAGSANLKITADSGTVNFDDDNITTTGAITGALTGGYIYVGNGSDASAAVNPGGDVEIANDGTTTLTADVVWPVAVFGTWAVDGDGANTNGAGLAGDDATLTEQAAAYAKTYDASNAEYVPLSTSSSGTDITNNYQFFSDTKADNDAVYFGGAIPFPELAIDMSGTVQDYTGDALTWEYWDGSAWSALTLAYDGTDANDQSGSRSFGQDGAISFVPPADWAATTVASQEAYWVRSRVSTTANIGANDAQTNSKEHELVTPADGFEAPQDGTVTRIRLSDAASTLHTSADVKFILHNFTTGAHSGELTFAQDKRSDVWTPLTLSVADGDELAVVVTQEDGTNEVTNAALELHATLE